MKDQVVHCSGELTILAILQQKKTIEGRCQFFIIPEPLVYCAKLCRSRGHLDSLYVRKSVCDTVLNSSG